MSEQVTYLVANFNNGWAFPDLLSSLEQQTDSHWLCLVCDDASTDDSSPSIQRQLGASPVSDRIRFLQNPTNLGYIGTLKRLIQSSETDIVAVLDADDALMPEATAELLSAYNRTPKAAFVYSKYWIMDDTFMHRRSVGGAPIPPTLSSMQGGFVAHLRSFRRELYGETEGLDETMLYAEDRDLIFKLEERTKPVFIDKELYLYRHVADSQSQDPIKRDTGYRNYGRAWNKALKRREIRGLRKWFAMALFWSGLPIRPYSYFRRLSPWLWGFQNRTGFFKPGRLNRTGRWHG
jgi:glycosyltransferase involved in cell wall biosynthesis